MTGAGMLLTLSLGGLMGLLGQGLRAAVGLKTMAEDARALQVSAGDLFQAARLITSLIIGFLVGMAAALPMDLSGVVDWRTLLSIVAVGYAGTDFIEGFISRYLTPATGTGLSPSVAANAGLAPIALASQSLLAANFNALAVTVPANAKQFVYSVLRETLPTAKIEDTTTLAALGYDDAPSCAALAGRINAHRWHGVHVDVGAIQNCTDVAAVIKVVAAAEK